MENPNQIAEVAPRAAVDRRKMIQSFFIGGLLPVIAFSLIEDHFGVIWGLIAGMVFGFGEIIWEWTTQKKVSGITWAGNGMILVLGAVSLFTQNGIWFKLQPALIEAAMGLILWGSLLMGKSLLLGLAKKQPNWNVPAHAEPILEHLFRGMTFRIGLFFNAHAALAAWAAFKWSTAAWAILKGVGFTGTFIVYMVAETAFLRYRFASK